MKIWEPCDGCDDFVCNIHGQHAHDCSCPVLEVWLEHDRSPYDDEVTDDAIQFVNDNPLDEDD